MLLKSKAEYYNRSFSGAILFPEKPKLFKNRAFAHFTKNNGNRCLHISGHERAGESDGISRRSACRILKQGTFIPSKAAKIRSLCLSTYLPEEVMKLNDIRDEGWGKERHFNLNRSQEFSFFPFSMA